MKKQIGMFVMLLVAVVMVGQNTKRWAFMSDKGIRWTVKNKAAHQDHVEMSGLKVSAIVHYGISDQGTLELKKKLVFPMLRTIPNNTHASLIVDFFDPDLLELTANGIKVKEFPVDFKQKGNLFIRSSTNTPLVVTRTLFPSVDKPALIELFHIKNTGAASCEVAIRNLTKPFESDPAKSVYGKYIVQMDVRNEGNVMLAPGDDYTFAAVYSGRKQCDEVYSYSPDYEMNKRNNLVNEIFGNLVLETPNDTINRAFAFAKLRAAESIYDTKGGLMHGPGGEAYYAAIWANDQAEYASPFFPFLGNTNANESAINCYRLFARYMNPEYKPIPSSIVAEGADIWNGAGDRGDMAMIAYGASRYALTTGNKGIAKEVWPLITWCFEYLERKKTPEGVIASDNDELEGRFYAGKVNLSTNGLAYGGYLTSASLAEELGYKDVAVLYRARAKMLRAAIEAYFGANVQGFDTYCYFKGNDKLRAWICVPLVMGITERKDQTIQALFSKYLWTSNGILTESGSTTFWDRSTLYAFRGLFANAATDKCMKYFAYYSATRLLGEHVPYPVEAWPEGNQRHLSAESALYCRAVTEGLFGIHPTGLNKFTATPWLPIGWSRMNLRKINAFGRSFDMEVTRARTGEVVRIKMENGSVMTKLWDGKKPLEIVLP